MKVYFEIKEIFNIKFNLGSLAGLSVSFIYTSLVLDLLHQIKSGYE